MSLSLDQIKALETIELDTFEIRGAKSGIINAKTTGPLYTGGTYDPYDGILYGSAVFASDSSVITNLMFSAPYNTHDATTLRDGDVLTVDASTFLLTAVVDSTSVWLDSSSSGFVGSKDFTATLIARDYLIEPDVGTNTFYGTALFTSSSNRVYGSGTTWLTDLTTNDFIKRNDYQQYYRIQSVLDNTTIQLVSTFGGSTLSGPYTAKKLKIDQMDYRYTKNDFEYEKNGGFWKILDETTASHLLATSYDRVMADGVTLRFVHALSANDPDIMDKNAVLNKLLAKKTQRTMFQFSMPVVPNPEDSLTLRINNHNWDRYPSGNSQYVVSYSADPLYISPPPLSERLVASLMFLAPASGPVTGASNGDINFKDATGTSIVGVMPGSEIITINGTVQQAWTEYLFDADAGVATASQVVMNEPVVKYVGRNISQLLEYGLSVTLDDQTQTFSIPPKITDQVRIVPEFGRVVPSDKDHPGPGEEYLVHYQVPGRTVSGETVIVSAGLTSFRAKLFPIKDNSVMLIKNGEILDEGTDFRVSTRTGRIIMTTPFSGGEAVSISYTPLSAQTDGLTYVDGTDYCSPYGVRATIVNNSSFQLTVPNYSLDLRSVNFLKIRNDTKSQQYDLNGLTQLDRMIQLAKDSCNLSIGMDSTDVISVDYRFAGETLEYFPLSPNLYSVSADSSRFFLQGMDATGLFSSGAVARFAPSNSAKVFNFLVDSVSYDGEDTILNFASKATEDIPNPNIQVTDASVSFVPVGTASLPIVTGSKTIIFPGLDSPILFRQGDVLKIGQEVYGVSGASWDGSSTVVNLTATSATDHTSITELASISISDCPIYSEGSTAVSASKPIVTSPVQPGLFLSYQTGTALFSTDASALTVVSDASTYRFDWNTYPTLSDLSGGLSSGPFNVQLFTPDWSSSRLQVQTNVPVWIDSSTSLPVRTTLRLDGAITDAFSVASEALLLDSTLMPGQRYDLDYVGRRYLGSDATVSFFARYFTTLAAGSKIEASFEYDNLDQFYVQTMTERQFLESVIQPAIDEENAQISGGGGQGGSVPGDEDQGNAEGGLINDPYRQRDLEIWSRIYENIYDYFDGRMRARAGEMLATTGQRFCNVDGFLSAADMTQIPNKAFSRLWPTSDWTSFEPKPIAPIAGQAPGPGTAIFTNGSATVSGQSTIWDRQLRADDFIRPADSTTDLKISSVNSATSLTLNATYTGPTSSSDGENFVITSQFPLFDDDGNMGAKIKGIRTSISPRLADGDVFKCYVDGTAYTSTFTDPSPFFRVRRYSLSDAAETINNDISQITASVENVFDPNTSYGTKTVMVLRTNFPFNRLEIATGTSAANPKLGFTSDMTSIGNFDKTSSGAELFWIDDERQHLLAEDSALGSVISSSAANKLDRTTLTVSAYYATVLTEITGEALAIPGETADLNLEVAALEELLLEPGQPGEAETQTALANAFTALTDCTTALAYDNSILTNWQGTGDGIPWALDFQQNQQIVNGLDSTGVAVETAWATPITGQIDFVLQAYLGFDRRIANFYDWITFTTLYTPITYFQDTSTQADGTWTGWQNSLPVDGSYSTQSQVHFYLGQPVLFTIAAAADKTSAMYETDTTSLVLGWIDSDGTSHTNVYNNTTYPTVSLMKTAINTEPGFTASGSAVHDSSSSVFKITTELIDMTANVYPGLRPCWVDYQTISERYLSDRTSFIDLRLTQLISRFNYLDNIREEEIIQGVSGEELLRSLGGDWGNLYTWANNRFNRVSGSEAKLFQIKQQIARNAIAARANRSLA